MAQALSPAAIHFQQQNAAQQTLQQKCDAGCAVPESETARIRAFHYIQRQSLCLEFGQQRLHAELAQQEYQQHACNKPEHAIF